MVRRQPVTGGKHGAGGQGLAGLGDERAATITVPVRYLEDDGRWLNDQAADAHPPNGLGGGGGVADLTRAR